MLTKSVERALAIDITAQTKRIKLHQATGRAERQSFLVETLRDGGKVKYELLREFIREAISEDVRKRGNQYCAYVDDKLTKKEKENNPKKYKGKKVGSVQRTKSGKIRMKARACYASKKKANNAMAAAMMG